ncbi:hypothetical protein [Vibrio sp. SCSIO 43136]|uniref:DUF6933 domain-containing protein n=1 Tax=Vibrio sp. SCSIO 43136 TaxID=2819101 RepID=UPI0020765495|nr:hypothetical protein [Vibrio sp. SCSIO 43136]USD64500.1 hypothetical protein J4N39_10335 [Vibrio sp. SCSIO 43136]
MLVFNCTKAAADFFTVTRGGKKQSPIEQAPTSVIDDTEQDNQLVSSWLVHAIKIQRKSVLIAVHVQTRYAMVFVGLKKGSWVEFTQQFTERLFYNMQFFGEAFDLCDEQGIGNMLANFISIHHPPHFCQRGDRSVQSHINELAWQFEDRVHEIGCLPDGPEQTATFDEWANSMIRSTKNHKGYFHPDEEMFIIWMQSYRGLEESQVQSVREKFMRLRGHVVSRSSS